MDLLAHEKTANALLIVSMILFACNIIYSVWVQIRFRRYKHDFEHKHLVLQHDFDSLLHRMRRVEYIFEVTRIGERAQI